MTYPLELYATATGVVTQGPLGLEPACNVSSGSKLTLTDLATVPFPPAPWHVTLKGVGFVTMGPIAETARIRSVQPTVDVQLAVPADVHRT